MREENAFAIAKAIVALGVGGIAACDLAGAGGQDDIEAPGAEDDPPLRASERGPPSEQGASADTGPPEDRGPTEDRGPPDEGDANGDDDSAADYYVDPEGDDDDPGTSDEPFETLQRAADAVAAGDTVIVREGKYDGFYLTASGQAGDPIRFEAEDGVYVDGSNPVTDDGINLEGASHVVVEGFGVVDMPRHGIRAVTCEYVSIRENDVFGSASTNFLVGFCDDIRIEDNLAVGATAQHGVYVSNSSQRPQIRGNTVVDNNQSGIQLNADVHAGGEGVIRGAEVEENTLIGNGAEGGAALNADGVQESVFQNNLVYETRAGGLALYKIDGAAPSARNVVANNTIHMPMDSRWAVQIRDGSTHNTLVNNIFLHEDSARGALLVEADSAVGLESDHNALTDRISADGGDTVISLDDWRAATGQDGASLKTTAEEVFADSCKDDYRLASGSPAIDAAATQRGPRGDLEGTPRPIGAESDIGALESCRDCLWVDPEGDDDNSGTREAPLETLQAAADGVATGQTVVARAGEYEPFELTEGGAEGERVHFVAAAGAVVGPASGHGINLEGASHVDVHGFQVRGVSGHGIRAVACEDVRLRNNTSAESRENNVLAYACDDVVIEGNDVVGSLEGHGVNVSGESARTAIRTNSIRENALSGIQITAVEADIVQNEIVENGAGGGAAINGDGLRASAIENNFLADNASGGISLYRLDGEGLAAGNRIRHNTVLMPEGSRWALELGEGSCESEVTQNVLAHEDPSAGAIAATPGSLVGTYSNSNLVTDRFSLDGGETILTLADWQQRTGLDTDSTALRGSDATGAGGGQGEVGLQTAAGPETVERLAAR